MTQLLLLLVVGGVALLGLTMLLLGARSTGQPDAISDRLTQFTERKMSLEEMELQVPFHQRVIVPLLRSILESLSRVGPKAGYERLRVNLQKAGNPGNLTPAMFSGIRIVLALLLAAIFSFFVWRATEMPLQQRLIGPVLGLVLGYMLPTMWLGQQIRKRQHVILKTLPDALDLLTISVEAGLSFDLACSRVVDKWDNELGREFRKVLSDMRLGRSRAEALRDMATRTGVDDVQTFAAAIIQADKLGVSMTKILRIQSEQLRTRRRQRAEQLAQQAPIKMLFPMVFLIFPALFVVILGPAVPRLLEAFG